MGHYLTNHLMNIFGKKMNSLLGSNIRFQFELDQFVTDRISQLPILQWVENNPANIRIFPTNICIFCLMVLRWLLLRMSNMDVARCEMGWFSPPVGGNQPI